MAEDESRPEEQEQEQEREDGGGAGEGDVEGDNDRDSLRGRDEAPAEDREGSTRGDNGRERQESEDGPFSLHVADLSFRSKSPDLREAFGKYGTVKDCTVCKHPTGDSRGFGFVTFATKAEADAAIEGLDGKKLNDRDIKVQHSRRNSAYRKTPGQYLGPKSLSLKYGGGGRGRDERGAGGGLTRQDLRREGDRYRPYPDDRRGVGGGGRDGYRDSYRDRYDRYDDGMAGAPVGYGGRDRYDGGGYGRDRFEDRSGPRGGGGGYGGGHGGGGGHRGYGEIAPRGYYDDRGGYDRGGYGDGGPPRGYSDRGYGGGGGGYGYGGGYDGGGPPPRGYDGDYPPPRGGPPADYGRRY